MNGYWCLFIFTFLKKKSHLIHRVCILWVCEHLIENKKVIKKFFVLLFPQQLMCRKTLNPHQIMRGSGSPQSSSLGRQSHRLCSLDSYVYAMLFPPQCCQPLGQWLSKAKSSCLSAQYKLLIDYTSPLVSQLNLSYSVLTACVVCFVSQLGLSSGKVWRHGLFWFISRMCTAKTNQILFTIELSVHYLW